MQLTKNFHLNEFLASQTATRRGIPNEPKAEHLAAIRSLAEKVMQPVRDKFGPTTITSGYRSPALNAMIGGASTSQHSRGEAADFKVMGVSNKEVAEWIIANLEFDQLILEGHNPTLGPNSGWIHVSFTTTRANRKQVLTATFVNGRPVYSNGINV